VRQTGSVSDIRNALPADLDDLVRLALAFYAESGFSTPAAELRHNLARLLDSEWASVRVVDGTGSTGSIAAFAVTTAVLSLESGVCAELQDMYVSPEHRRTGIARALV
jgi:aminoglycoside 6'-N-acetyltransferase I